MSTPDRHDEDELPPGVRDALAALPRARAPGRLLEERTVRALRDRGTLAPPRVRRVPRAWAAAAAAAGIALFAGGMAAGQWVGVRQTAELVTTAPARDPGEAAMAVQQTGSAYVQALATLASLEEGAAAPGSEQGREVAVRMLRAAADELLRIAPDDPVAAAVLAAFQRDTVAVDPAAQQRVVWF